MGAKGDGQGQKQHGGEQKTPCERQTLIFSLPSSKINQFATIFAFYLSFATIIDYFYNFIFLIFFCI